MTGRVDESIYELIALHALDALDPVDAARIDAAVAADPALARELATLRDAAGALPVGLPSEPPPTAVRARLEASIDAMTRPPRLERFAARLSSLFDVTVDKARMLLGWIDDPARWEAFAPGAQLMHLPAGPAVAGADCGFVRLEPGATFPWHHHDGEEVTVVLQGRGRDHDGTPMLPGDEVVLPADSEHDFTCEGALGSQSDEAYIFAVRVFGVRFDVERPDRSGA